MSIALPISAKGIVLEDGKIWLRKNERNEWELPGGRIEPGEQPRDTVVREIQEELGIAVDRDSLELCAACIYQPAASQNADESSGVLLLIYQCKFLQRVGFFESIGEAGPAEFRQFSATELHRLQSLPTAYRSAIEEVFEQFSHRVLQ